MSRVSFTVPGRPVPWKRARSNGKARYTDPAQSSYAAKLRWCAIAAVTGRQWDRTGRYRVDVHAFIRGSRPDVDNIAKIVGDALQGKRGRSGKPTVPGVLWDDDEQIDDERTRKTWVPLDEDQRLEVTVELMR